MSRRGRDRDEEDEDDEDDTDLRRSTRGSTRARGGSRTAQARAAARARKPPPKEGERKEAKYWGVPGQVFRVFDEIDEDMELEALVLYALSALSVVACALACSSDLAMMIQGRRTIRHVCSRHRVMKHLEKRLETLTPLFFCPSQLLFVVGEEGVRWSKQDHNFAS